MSERSEGVVEAAAQSGKNLLVREFVTLAERHHDDAGRGVARETLQGYARDLADARAGESLPFTPDELSDLVDERLASSASFAGEDRLYQVAEGRVSAYPARWHDRLGNERAITDVVGVLNDALADADASLDRGGAGRGVPENLVVDVASAVGPVDRETARAALAEARDEGLVVEDADQHPKATVRLAEA
jgi:hypothetical protein